MTASNMTCASEYDGDIEEMTSYERCSSSSFLLSKVIQSGGGYGISATHESGIHCILTADTC